MSTMPKARTQKNDCKPVRKVRSEAMAAIHSAATDLFETGVIDKRTMREYDQSCLEPVALSAEDVRRIRAKLRVSQQVLARAIGATKSTVAKWEAGLNTPNLMAQRLLRVIDKHSLSILD